MVNGSDMTINPNIPDAHVLRGWYDSVVADQSFTAASTAGLESGGVATLNRAEIRTIQDIKTNLEITEKAEMFSCRGTVLHVPEENPAYPACLDKSCRKKVNKTLEGWHCEKCGKTWEKPQYRYITCNRVPEYSTHVPVRYIFSMGVSDATGQAWLQGFHDVGLAVFKMSADELMEIKVRTLGTNIKY
jgi:replication factor A1